MGSMKPLDLQDTEQKYALSRRRFLQLGGAAVVATSLYGCSSLMAASTQAAFPRAATRGGTTAIGGANLGMLNHGTKPTFTAAQGSIDPFDHSVADTLFWSDIMMEHSLLMAMGLSGPDLAAQRRQAEAFQKQFADHFARVQGGAMTRANYVAFNNETIAMVRPLHQFKMQMRDAQASGKLHSLIFPSFYNHIGREAERFMARLAMYNAGTVQFDRPEVISFWGITMEEHAMFIAQMLDPAHESALIKVADVASDTFRSIRSRPTDKAAAMAGVESIIDFKTAAEKGIRAGEIQSIIHPILADHVRREAVRFEDELKRTA